MLIRVVTVRQGSNQILENWYEPGESNHPGQIQLHEEDWRKSTCLWPIGILDGTADLIDVFLCLDEETLSEDYEIPTLKKVIEKAHSSMWVAELYLVVSNRLRLENQFEFQLVRANWFSMLLDNYISDVLELDLNLPKIRFNSAVQRATVRSQALYENVSSSPWKCFIYSGKMKPSPDVEILLANFTTDNPHTSKNCLLILRDYQDETLEIINDFLQRDSRRKLIVGMLDEFENPLFYKVKKLCEKWSSRVIEFRGFFELHYFLQKLNAIYYQPNISLFRTPTLPKPNNVFGSRPTRQLLITHSFDSKDAMDGYVHAAADVWTLQKELGKDLEIIIHPAVQIQSFSNKLEKLEDLLAWVHIGHGDGENGLQEAGGLYRESDEWLSCFASYKKNLALAIFLSCHSHHIAQKFYEAGVGVTIGFENQLPKNVCGNIAVEVVRAALESNGNPDKILSVFEKKKILIKDALPKAFYTNY